MTLEEIIQTHWLGDNLWEIIEFFIEFYENYKDKDNLKIVITSEQCLTLFKVCINIQDKVSKEEFRAFLEKHLITQENIISETPNIIRDFQNNGTLPHLVILDFILFYGRRANRLILDYENAIKTKYFEKYKKSIPEYLIPSSIDILAYAHPDNVLFIFQRYRHRIYIKKQYKHSIERNQEGNGNFYIYNNRDLNSNFNNLIRNLMQLYYIVQPQKKDYPKEITEAIDDSIYAIAIETEQEAFEMSQSGVFASDESLANWGRRSYTIFDFIAICQKALAKKDANKTEISNEIIKELLLKREKEGYITLYKNDVGITEVRALPQALIIKPIRYQEYIPVLIAVTKRCHDSQLNLKKELEKLEEALKKDNILFPANELYIFLKNIQIIGQKIYDWNILVMRPEFNKEIEKERIYELCKKQAECLKRYLKL